jgi:hypothetical protein
VEFELSDLMVACLRRSRCGRDPAALWRSGTRLARWT